ncbi:MAG: flagellin FliC, partial [Nitrospina sp.]|nr:flagellin FliC [Nitrospina sp.]
EGLRSDIRALRQATRNANDGMSLVNVAEGALNEQSGILIRLRELASQAATGTVGSTERASIQLEFSALRQELTRIANTTEFNGIGLIDGSLASSVASTSHTLIQIGIDNTANSRLDLNNTLALDAVTAEKLGLNVLSVSASAEALTALASIETAIASVTASRGKVGAIQNRLQRSVSSLSISTENLQAAESAIRDADIAHEIAELTRNQILVQTSTAMVGQSNLIPQSVLQLLT